MKKILYTLLLITGLNSAEFRKTFPNSACFYVGEAFLSSDNCAKRREAALNQANRYGADFVIDENCPFATRPSSSYREDGQYIYVDFWRYALAANRPVELNQTYEYSYPLHFPYAGKDTLYSFYIQYPYHLGILTKYLEIVGFDLAQNANGLQIGDKIIRINNISVIDPQAMNQLLEINETTPVKVTVTRQNQLFEAWITPIKVDSSPTIAKPYQKTTSDNIEYYLNPPRRASLYLGKISGSFIGNKLNADSYARARELGADYITVLPISDTYFQENGKGRFISRNELKKYGSQAALSRSASSYYPRQKKHEFKSYFAWAFLPSSLGIITSNEYIVIGFDPDAKANGVQLYDEILGINSIDRTQENYLTQLLNVYPGDTVTLNIIRNGKRIDVKVTAIDP